MLNASYATYVSGLVNDIGNSGSSAGSPATYLFQYLGPAINVDPNAPSLIRTEDALATLFAWFNANGGTNRRQRRGGCAGREHAGGAGAGVTKRRRGGRRRDQAARQRGLVRVDGVYRKYQDFYATRIDQSTGQVVNEIGDTFDVVVTENTNDVERQLCRHERERVVAAGRTARRSAWATRCRAPGATSTARPRTPGRCRRRSSSIPSTAIRAGASRSAISPPISATSCASSATYTAPLGDAGSLTLGGIQSFNTGNPYAAAENITIEPYVPQGLPYVGAPAEVPYFFTEPDAFRTEHSFSTDLSAHYRYRLPHAADAELFVKADVLNVFNRHAVDQLAVSQPGGADQRQRAGHLRGVQSVHRHAGARRELGSRPVVRRAVEPVRVSDAADVPHVVRRALLRQEHGAGRRRRESPRLARTSVDPTGC